MLKLPIQAPRQPIDVSRLSTTTEWFEFSCRVMACTPAQHQPTSYTIVKNEKKNSFLLLYTDPENKREFIYVQHWHNSYNMSATYPR